MIQTKEKIIQGSRYVVTQMTARRALRMKARLLKLFGKPLAQMFIPSNETPIDGLAFSRESAIKAIAGLCEELEDKAFESVIVELLSSVRKEGMELTEGIIDLEFAGDLATMYEVVWFVLEANYSNFFQALGITLPSHEAKPQATASSKKELKKAS